MRFSCSPAWNHDLKPTKEGAGMYIGGGLLALIIIILLLIWIF
jgi:hypothetical protein